jgi:restriction endonuclease Mrr
MATDEQIDSAMSEIHRGVAADLLKRISESPPQFFEYLVLDVLHAWDMDRTGTI